MTFSLSKPDFTKYLTSETKYSIAITADDSVTKKFPVLEDGPLEVALFWRTQFDEIAQLNNFDAANKFTNVLLLLRPFLTAPQKRKQNLFLVFVFAKNGSLSLSFCKNETRVSQRDWNHCTGMTHANLPPTLSTHHHERICSTAPATSLFISMQFSSHVVFVVFLVYKTLSQ
jgi:hypothetical protein